MYALMVLSTVLLSYTESKYKVVSDTRKDSLNQLKYIGVKIGMIAVDTLAPLLVRILFIKRSKDILYLQTIIFVLSSLSLYCMIGMFLVYGFYGRLIPRRIRDTGTDTLKKERILPQTTLFIISVILEGAAAFLIHIKMQEQRKSL